MAKHKGKGKVAKAEQNLTAVIGETTPLMDGPTAYEQSGPARGRRKAGG